MNESQLTSFVAEYIKGVDVMNCVVYAIDHDWTEPDDYADYGCRITFLDKDSCSVSDRAEVNKWHALHHNKFAKEKVAEDAKLLGTSFPPPFNFPSPEQFEVEELSDSEAKVQVETANMTYVFAIEPSTESDDGMAIASIVGMLPFGGSPIEIL
jgi:hypothetical protein